MNDWQPISQGGVVFVMDRASLPPDVLPVGYDYLIIVERTEAEGDAVGLVTCDLGSLRLLIASLKPSYTSIARAVENPDAVFAALRSCDEPLH